MQRMLNKAVSAFSFYLLFFCTNVDLDIDGLCMFYTADGISFNNKTADDGKVFPLLNGYK